MPPSAHVDRGDGGHQQYLHKNPHGYRCHSATGVPMPWPLEGIETKLA